MPSKLKYLFFAVALLLPAYADTAQSSELPAVEVLQGIFSKRESEIDLAAAKLAIDQLINPAMDADKVLSDINGMVSTLKSGLAPDMMPMDKILSLSAFLYEGGYWNNNQPFQYDFSDPFGQEINTKLLATYLKTKKGNCISMPILFVILADRLGLDVTLSTAPLHVFVKFKEPLSAKYSNVEATDRGQFVSDQFYREKSTITEQAIANKVYLQPLTKKQSVAVMAILLSEHFERQGQWQKSIGVAELILQQYPNYAYAMIKIGNGYSKLLSEQVAAAKVKGSYTPEEQKKMGSLYQQNLHWFEKAGKLGWQPQSQDENKAYLKIISKRTSSLTSTAKGK